SEVGLNQLTVRRSGVFLGLIALLFTLFSFAAPAQAADDPSTYPYSIAGTLLNNDEGVKDVTITATLDAFKGETKTLEDGSWEIKVPNPGKYTVTLDESTLPAGVSMTTKGGNVLEADLTQTDFAAVLFSLGAEKVVTVNYGDQFLIRLFAGVNRGLLLALAAIGISLIFGTTGLSNFAHGEMVSLGALVMWIAYPIMHLNILVSAGLAVAAATAFGFAQDAFLWKPLRKRRMGLNQMMIVSIGFSIVARYVMLLVFGGDTKDIGGVGNSIHLGPIMTSDITLISMLLCAVTLAGVALFLTKTRVGKATRAVSDNASLAASTGIDVERIIRIVWLVASALTGLAGVLYGLQFQANWLTGFDILLLLFAAVTLGGLGTALGATVGAMIIGLVVELSVLFIPTEMMYAAALVILIVILIVRPQGVLGKKQRIG
ncbi:MAG: hypothetical protein RL605_114, partial [Actinomycetota bacterium]